jgi:hypothetical protein
LAELGGQIVWIGIKVIVCVWSKQMMRNHPPPAN